MSVARTQIAGTADRLRDELLATLAELDRRRQAAFDVSHQIQRHRLLLVAALGASAAVAGTAVGISTWRRARRRRRLPSERVSSLMRAWKHPEWMAQAHPRQKHALARRIGGRVSVALATAVASQLARRGAARLWPNDGL